MKGCTVVGTKQQGECQIRSFFIPSRCGAPYEDVRHILHPLLIDSMEGRCQIRLALSSSRIVGAVSKFRTQTGRIPIRGSQLLECSLDSGICGIISLLLKPANGRQVTRIRHAVASGIRVSVNGGDDENRTRTISLEV